MINFYKETLDENYSSIINCFEEISDKNFLLSKENKELKQENEKYKEVIDKLSKVIYKIDDLRKNTGGYPTNYIDELVDILKEVEHE